VGIDAASKARRTGEAIPTRTRELFAQAGLGDYSRTNIEVLGSEAGNFGPHARTFDVREAVLRVAVMHPQKAALELFAHEIAPAGTSWSPGTTGAEGRPHPSPCIKQFAFLLDKAWLNPVVAMDGRTWAVEEVPLIRLAYARSGDKGHTSNIGVIARRPEWLALLRGQLTEQRVAQYLAHLVQGQVTRYDLPGIHALNFVCTQALDGGAGATQPWQWPPLRAGRCQRRAASRH